MKRDMIRLGICFLTAVAAGVLLHFLYDWSPNLLFAVLSPVRESVWEHLKLVFWPLLATSLLYTRRQRDDRAGWYLGVLTASCLLLLSGWVYHVRMARSSLAVDIALYVLVMALGFAVAVWVGAPRRWHGLLLLFVGVLLTLIVIFTFAQPDTLLFADLSLADALYTLPC